MSDQLTKFLRLRDVEAVTGLRKSAIYEKIGIGKFPKPVPLGDAPNSPVGWIETEVAAWQQARIAERDRSKVEISTLPRSVAA
jgi:prophage regulatory protein